ncbi:unnamed protein product, partial [Ilex paraguariensis]
KPKRPIGKESLRQRETNATYVFNPMEVEIEEEEMEGDPGPEMYAPTSKPGPPTSDPIKACTCQFHVPHHTRLHPLLLMLSGLLLWMH